MNNIFEYYFDLIYETAKTLDYVTLVNLSVVNKACCKASHILLYDRYYVDLGNLNLNLDVTKSNGLLKKIIFDSANVRRLINELFSKVRNIKWSLASQCYLAQQANDVNSDAEHENVDFDILAKNFKNISTMKFTGCRINGLFEYHVPGFVVDKVIFNKCVIDKFPSPLDSVTKAVFRKCEIDKNLKDILTGLPNITKLSIKLKPDSPLLGNLIDLRNLKLTSLKLNNLLIYYNERFHEVILSLYCCDTLQYLKLSNINCGRLDLSNTIVNKLRCYQCHIGVLVLCSTVSVIKIFDCNIKQVTSFSICTNLQQLICTLNNNDTDKIILDLRSNTKLRLLNASSGVLKILLTQTIIDGLDYLNFQKKYCRIIVDGVKSKDCRLLSQLDIRDPKSIKKVTMPMIIFIPNWYHGSAFYETLQYAHCLDSIHLERKICNKLILNKVKRLVIDNFFETGKGNLIDIVIYNFVEDLELTSQLFLHNYQMFPKNTIKKLKIKNNFDKEDDIRLESFNLIELAHLIHLSIDSIPQIHTISHKLQVLELCDITKLPIALSSDTLDLSTLVNLKHFCIRACILPFKIKAPINLKHFVEQDNQLCEDGYDWSNIQLLSATIDTLQLFKQIGSIKKLCYRPELKQSLIMEAKLFVLNLVFPIFWIFVIHTKEDTKIHRHFYGPKFIIELGYPINKTLI